MNPSGFLTSPPRLLLGVALLFWGGVTDHALIGLLCAFLVEARSWVGVRWQAGERGFVRAWHLTIVMLVLAAAWLWLMGDSYLRLFDVLIWLPVLFLPVILAQQYSLEERMPLNTFSYVARKKMLLGRRDGRAVDPVMVHVGYAYLGLVMIAAALGKSVSHGNPDPDEEMMFEKISLIGFGIVGGVALFFSSPVARRRPLTWGAAVLVVVVMGLSGVLGLRRLYDFMNGTIGARTGMDSSSEEAWTAIGSVGEIKQSYKVYWRVSGEQTKGFTLFRTASFNRYHQGIWNHRTMGRISRDLDYDEMYPGGDEFLKIWAFRQEDLMGRSGTEPGVNFRGESQEQTLLPIPEGAMVISGLAADGVRWNTLGTVVAENPDYGVLDFRIVVGDENLLESPPNDILDMHVPSDLNEPALRPIVAELDLEDLSDPEKVAVLMKFFRENFQYSLILGDGPLTGNERTRALSRFLRFDRRGHCEYYASAMTLLLRQAGVPARYCKGFSAQEKSLESDEWVLRGRHAHAWSRVYIGGTRTVVVDDDGEEDVTWSGGKWINVDATPPSWFALEGSNITWGQVMLDHLQRWREDFLLWRVQPGSRILMSVGMSVLGSLLALWVFWRVWRHRVRRRIRTIAGERDRADVAVTALHGLEHVAEPWLGDRPPGVALTRWLEGLGAAVPEAGPDLGTAVALHWKLRFDPLGPEEGERERLAEACRAVKKVLKAAAVR